MEKTYMEKFAKELGKSDSEQRREEAEERKKWEEQRTSEVGSNVAQNVAGRSALSRRASSSEKKDLFMPSILDPDAIATIVNDKSDLQQEMNVNGNGNRQLGREVQLNSAGSEAAASRVSELIAKAGAGSSFEGETLGIGGLDDVLAQVKRRVWTPLAAPPQLLEELGIHPVRGLLLYGKPGCGKTLLARTLGSILSPMRPITVVSGPEIMDKFVGSSEKVSIIFATR
jgi:ATP-dependent 26S proteasome regulatory subunit